MLEEIDHAVGVAPLIVIPRYNLEEPLFAGQVVLGGGKGIIDGGIAVMDEVGRHKVFILLRELIKQHQVHRKP